MTATHEKENIITLRQSINLYDVHKDWLAAPWIGHPGQTNADRDPTALSNHLRALKVLSLAAGFNGILEETPISAISLSPELIGVRVIDGLQLEALAKGKSVPKQGLVSNMVSIARGLALHASSYDRSDFQTGFSLRRSRLLKKIYYQEPFLRSEWPVTLEKDIQKHQAWLRTPILSSSEAEYRPENLAEDTIRNQRSTLGPYIKWRLDADLTSRYLVDLINVNEFSTYLNDIFTDRPDRESRLSGHKAANARAIALAATLRYLVATDQYDPVTGQKTPELAENRPERTLDELESRLNACNIRKRAFYKLGKQILKLGNAEEKGATKHKPPKWTPKDLHSICEEGFSSPARRCKNHAGGALQQFTRQRSAIMFGLSAETPLRIRTLSLIDWSDFKKLPDGRWKIRVSGKKLKVRFRKDELNVYTMVYSPKMSEYIDRYREVLKEYFGPDFEREVPWVFPTVSTTDGNGRQGCRSSLSRNMTQLALELRNVVFSPHDTRYIVATYAIQKMGAPGIMLAAKLLGDKPETILKYYVQELEDEAKEVEDYLNSLQR